MLPSVPFDPLTSNATEIEIFSVKTSKQMVVEVVEVTVALDPSITPQVPVTEPSLSVAVVQPLINLEKESVATDVDEKTEAGATPSVA